MAPAYKLSYFDIKGLGEPVRFMLSYGGLEFEDVRLVTGINWPALKPETPFGLVPMLEFGGKKLSQSAAICRYLGREFDINGKDNWEKVQIDIVVDTITDFRMQVGSYHYDEDASSKATKKVVLYKETIPFYLSRFDAMVKNNGGFFVAGKLTWADIFWTGLAGYIVDMLDGEDFTKDYPNLKALENKVLAIPNIKAWVSKRPK